MGVRPVVLLDFGFDIVRLMRVSYHILFLKEKDAKELAF